MSSYNDDKLVEIPLKLLEELWTKLDDCTDRHSMGDTWQSTELADLIKRIEAILKEYGSKVLEE